MARLNEPPVSTDSIDTLRRKFMRQNRDLARVNSHQSLRIRSLENDCARLLSDNLDLRGQILRLENEIEVNSAQRIADHALEIKNKLEAQLIEWGSLLSGLGLEPPAKRHSPGRRRIAKPRSSFGRSPPQQRLQNLAKDAEALNQEGRLPSIQENKPYPRQTLNRDEILALCSEAADTTDSPDLGPPPVSRFVEEEPVKVDSPCRPAGEGDAIIKMDEISATSSPERLAPPKLAYVKKPADDPEKRDVSQGKMLAPGEPRTMSQPPKTGSKRKFGTNDENENHRGVRTSSERAALPKATAGKPTPARDLKNRRSVKDLPVGRRDARDKPVPVSSATTERKPLASKSTNEDVSSPRKPVKKSLSDEIALSKIESLKETLAKERSKQIKRIIAIDIPNRPPPALTTVTPDHGPGTPMVDVNLLPPDTPERSASRSDARDTPPPADISSHGETSRPSRRARSSVSYAEPNLRDKMRRPTKELFDAVAGEGKYIQRHQKTDEHGVVIESATKIKLESDDTDPWKSLSAAEALAKEAARRASMLSPLAPKGASTSENLSHSVIPDRRKRSSSVALKGSGETKLEHAVLSVRKTGTSGEGMSKINGHADPYEFTTSSPAGGVQDDKGSDVISARESRTARRSSGLLHERILDKTSKSTSSRKRASMAMLKRSYALEGSITDDEDDSYEPPGQASREIGSASDSARDRISRRRSMML